MLEIKHVAKNFGGLQALSNISVSVKPREFVGLIGPNGSGKTTLLNCVSGLYTPDSGSIRFGGSVISRLRPHKIYRLGIGRTFQISKVFNRLTVLENLRVPALTEGKMNHKEINKRSMNILKELNLKEHGNSAAESLFWRSEKASGNWNDYDD